MTKLLKDMPEHMERIENNYNLSQEIKDCLENNEQQLFEKNSGHHFDEVNAVHSDDYGSVSQDIIIKITDFVNQNYEWKGVKS